MTRCLQVDATSPSSTSPPSPTSTPRKRSSSRKSPAIGRWWVTSCQSASAQSASERGRSAFGHNRAVTLNVSTLQRTILKVVSRTQVTRNSSDGPLLFIFFGFVFLLGALGLSFAGLLGVPQPESLQQVTGTVLEVRRTQNPKGPPQIRIEIREGKSVYHLVQDDFGQDATGMRRVQVGDSVMAHVQPDFLLDRHWIWGLERDGQILISYEEVLEGKRRFAAYLDSMAYWLFGVGVVFLSTGSYLRWRYGFWR